MQSDNRDFVNLNNSGVITSNNAIDGFMVQDTAGVNFSFGSGSFGGKAVDKKSEAAGAKGKVMQRGRGELRKSLESQSYGNALQGGNGSVRFFNDIPQQQQVIERNVNGSLTFQQGQNDLYVESVIDLNGGSNMTFEVDLGGRSGQAPAWTQVGGLSLPIQIPEEGSKTVFSRVGGSPKVTLALRPRQASTRTLTWLWSLCWAAFAVWVVRRIRHASGSQSFRPVLGFLAGLAAVGFLLLPDQLRALSLVVFIVSLIAALLIGIRQEAEPQ